MMIRTAILVAATGTLVLAACGDTENLTAQIDSAPDLDSAPVATQTRALAVACTTNPQIEAFEEVASEGDNTFVTRDGRMFVSANTSGGLGSQPEVSGTIEVTRPLRASETSVDVDFQVVSGGALIGGAPLTTFQEASISVDLVVTDVASGAVLCVARNSLLSISTPGGFASDTLTPGPNGVSCQFDRSPGEGTDLEIEVTLNANAAVLIWPGNAEAQAEINLAGITVEHCEQQVAWCNAPGDELHVGDFDGDNLDDLLCHTAARMLEIDFSNDGFDDASAYATAFNFCDAPGDQLHIGDTNGNGRDDAICHSTADGFVDVMHSRNNVNNVFPRIDWTSRSGWCFHAGVQSMVADLSGDGNVELICLSQNGVVDVSNGGGGGFTMRNNQQVQTACLPSNGRLLWGDTNGDDRDDFVCRFDGPGWTAVEITDNNGRIQGNVDQTTGNWCRHGGAFFSLEDVNLDGRADAICHTDNSGFIDIDFADPAGFFDGFNNEQNDFDFLRRRQQPASGDRPVRARSGSGHRWRHDLPRRRHWSQPLSARTILVARLIDFDSMATWLDARWLATAESTANRVDLLGSNFNITDRLISCRRRL